MPHDQAKESVVSLRERVKSPPAASIVESYFRPAIEAEIRLQFDAEMRIHLAHAVMLAECGIVAESEIAKILKVLVELRQTGAGSLNIDYTHEDLYSYTEKYIVERLGPETGGRLHTGRSRNDLHTTAWRLTLRAKLINLLDNLNVLRQTLLHLAGEHTETVMPGYTHTQHAQPISLGYYLLAAFDLLSRDYRRLSAALDCCDRSPLGSGALSTTGFPINRQRSAEFLGFSGLVEVAYDGVAIRDDLHEAVGALAIMMTGISRLATDLQIWNTMEFGMIELDDAYSSVSSIMPQKKNPQALEHVKAVAAISIGSANTVFASSKNTALADVNDGVSAGNVPALDAIERATLALAVMEGAIRTMNVRKEIMQRLAEIGFGTATELADIIVRETGISFRMAHNLVGRMVREAIEAGHTAMDLTTEQVDAASQALFGYPLKIPASAISRALNPSENLKSRTVTGGPAPELMTAMIAERQEKLRDAEHLVEQLKAQIRSAETLLSAAVQDIIGKTTSHERQAHGTT